MANLAYPILECLGLFFAGVLAGIEFIVRFGVRAPLLVLDDQPQIQLRQALIRAMRVVVPAVFALTALCGVALTVTHQSAPGFAFRCAGLLAIGAWTLATFIGTVPINKAILSWRPDAPPDNWKARIRTWERLDTARTLAALAAFACFLAAIAAQLAAVSGPYATGLNLGSAFLVLLPLREKVAGEA